MAHKYSTIVIICNPNSTGRSVATGQKLARDLHEALPNMKLRLRYSRHRGHAEQITYRTTLLSRHALIISVSGDGGYNEVVNGAMRASRLGRKISVGLVPAGNANDHYATRHRGKFVQRVIDGDEDTIELIKLKAGHLTRYAHSYIGLGITPQASEKLNASKLNLWQEAKIVASVVWHIKSVKLLVGDTVEHYSSLVFSNVGRMSKVIRVPKHRIEDDGKVEMSYIYHRNKFKLITQLFQAAMFGLETHDRISTFRFKTMRTTSVQIDGEIRKLDAETNVSIDVQSRALHCIV